MKFWELDTVANAKRAPVDDGGGRDGFSLPRNPQRRKIPTNNFGIREMSGNEEDTI
jgi:hypothetical protein